MASQAVSARYVAAQTATVLLSVATGQRVTATAVLVTAGGGNTVEPSVVVKIGPDIIADHPGVPAGGGYSFTGIDPRGGWGDDLTVTCDDPGGTVAVTVLYQLDTR